MTDQPKPHQVRCPSDPHHIDRESGVSRRYFDAQRLAALSLSGLAQAYHTAITAVCAEGDYKHRQPLERRAEAMFALGRYIFEDAFNVELRKYDWPTPVLSSHVPMTKNSWDEDPH